MTAPAALLMWSHELQRRGSRVFGEVPKSAELCFLDQLASSALLEVVLDLRKGCERVPEELHDLAGPVSTKAFGNVPADRSGGIAKAIAEFEIPCDTLSGANFYDLPPQGIRELPALKISKVGECHARTKGIGSASFFGVDGDPAGSRQ